MIETNLYRDHFQNFKRYNIPKGEVVIDPCAGSGSTLVAATELNRKAYGFEIDRQIYAAAYKWVAKMKQRKLDIDTYGFSKTEYDNAEPNLFTETF